MSRQWFLLAVVWLIVLPVVPPGRADEVQPEPPMVEPFDGKLRLNWKILRPDEKRWSLKKNKGKLTITTQRGSIRAGMERNELKAKNLFLINNPFGRASDFEVSVRVCDFKPTALWQQGGLLVYDDDDNYIKFVCESTGDQNGGTQLVLIHETEAKPVHLRAPTPENTGKVWLRLTRRKDKYEYASSGDGKKWTINGNVAWGEKGPAKIGILAKNGGSTAPEIDVCFEDFRARSLVPVRARTD
jgi:regulation of enolase protein 1 (concanavalin A-like superfamily)